MKGEKYRVILQRAGFLHLSSAGIWATSLLVEGGGGETHPEHRWVFSSRPGLPI